MIERFETEVGGISENVANAQFINNSIKLEFATRMIFSCLIDADFLVTEKHYRNGEERKIIEFKPQELLEKLEAERLRKPENARINKADGKLIKIRNRTFDKCLQRAGKP